MARSYNRDTDDDRIDETWTEDEIAWYLMGPFDGKIPGLVRRVRRILDVSQRGLLKVAGLTVEIHDEDGAEVTPMRDDGGRDQGGRRFPAHVDLTVRGWWVPRRVQSTMSDYGLWTHRSRARRNPQVRFRTCPILRGIDRMLYGTPDDHPALLQLVAEAVHLDDVRAERRDRARGGRPRPPEMGAALPRSA